MGKKIRYDFTDSFVLFPKNLPDVHDQASELLDAKKKELLNKQIKKAYKNLLEKYRFTKNGLTLIPPKAAKEIVDEGHFLHHCVHQYVERVANGKSVILFIRKMDNITEPFYTVELRDNEINQIRGQGNSVPTPEINKFLELWKQRKLLPAKTYTAA